MIEGVQFKWADAAIVRADYVIVLDIPRWKNILLIVKRLLHHHRSGKWDGRGSLAALRQELAWLKDYHHHERHILSAKLQPWDEKVIIAHSSACAVLQVDANWPRQPLST